MCCAATLRKTSSLRLDLKAFFPIRVDPHLLSWIIVMPSFKESTTGRESLELMSRFLFRMIMLRQKTLHSEEPRDADMFDWAAHDPALRRELPLISPI